MSHNFFVSPVRCAPPHPYPLGVAIQPCLPACVQQWRSASPAEIPDRSARLHSGPSHRLPQRPRHDKVPRCCCCCCRRVRRRLRHATQDHAPGIMTPGACTRTTVDSCCMVSSASRHHSALRNSSPCTSCVVRRRKMRRWPGGDPQASHRPGLLAAASPSRGRGRGE